MYYPDDLIREIRESNDIVSVISEYMTLTKKGSNHFGLCPFHGEKTPSFSVNPRRLSPPDSVSFLQKPFLTPCRSR